MKKEESVLKSAKTKIEVKVPKKYSPQEFFINRTGLYVWSGFSENILPKAKAVVLNNFALSSFDLTERLSDKKIESELIKKHLFTETHVCAIIAGLIEKQSKGQKGILLNNGYANLFYTKSRVVRVRWHDGEWRVYAWLRGDGTWYAGKRVFSPENNKFLPGLLSGSFLL